MARRILRQIAKADGAGKAQADCFAECCINILQQGCSYPSGVEKRIERLLKDREETVCADILLRVEKSQHDTGRKRWRSRSPDRNDRQQTLYYVDKNPYEYNPYRPREYHDTRGRKRRKTDRPNRY